MPLSPDGRLKLGYARYENDVDHTCFYCRSPLDKDYFDYVPPRDVKDDPELSAAANVPFVYVTTCHNCKTRLYPKRYLLKTPEMRFEFINSKKRSPMFDDIKRQLMTEPLKPWQGTSIDDNGRKVVIDLDDSLLSADVLAARANWVAQNFAVAQTFEQNAPWTEDVRNSGPQGDVHGAQDIDLGF